MESKNVKIIDEHNIDRDANVICSFKVDGNGSGLIGIIKLVSAVI